MRVLVTNDDGVTSPGLHALASSIGQRGHEVLVVAPSSDYSGFSAALGPLHVNGKVDFERLELREMGGVEAIAVDGPPALCVLSACLDGFGSRPDLVVSGVNVGVNTGRAVLHSGTVGAAFTANGFGIRAIAVSQAEGDPHHWATAAGVAAEFAEWIVEQRDVFTLNVNVPNVAPQPLPAHVARLDAGGEVQTAMYEAAQGELRLRFRPAAPEPGTDSAIVAAGCVAITPLVAVHVHEIVVDGALSRVTDHLNTLDRARVA
jgi:5'-nucleotidase